MRPSEPIEKPFTIAGKEYIGEYAQIPDGPRTYTETLRLRSATAEALGDDAPEYTVATVEGYLEGYQSLGLLSANIIEEAQKSGFKVNVLLNRLPIGGHKAYAQQYRTESCIATVQNESDKTGRPVILLGNSRGTVTAVEAANEALMTDENPDAWLALHARLQAPASLSPNGLHGARNYVKMAGKVVQEGALGINYLVRQPSRERKSGLHVVNRLGGTAVVHCAAHPPHATDEVDKITEGDPNRTSMDTGAGELYRRTGALTVAIASNDLICPSDPAYKRLIAVGIPDEAIDTYNARHLDFLINNAIMTAESQIIIQILGRHLAQTKNYRALEKTVSAPYCLNSF